MFKPSSFRFLLMAFATVLTIASCSKDSDDDGTPSDPFLGKWEIVQASGTLADDNLGTVYDFKADGSVAVSQSGFTNNATYTRTDSELTIDFSGIVLEYTYTLSSTQLVMDNKTSDQVFTLERQ